MSNLQINNTNSFSFSEDYNASHGLYHEFSDTQVHIFPQSNLFNPQGIQQDNENNQQVNLFIQPANVNAQPINPNAQSANVNVQPSNVNTQLNNVMIQPTNENVSAY